MNALFSVHVCVPKMKCGALRVVHQGASSLLLSNSGDGNSSTFSDFIVTGR